MKCKFARLLVSSVAFAAGAFFVGCAGQYSAEQTLAEDSYMVYRDTYKAFAEAEKRYMNILFNLERMPDEEELLIMKRETILELEHLRELMMQARADFEDAAKKWDAALQEKLAEKKNAEEFKSPNLKNSQDEKRSSPGEMTEEEAMAIGQKKY